MTEQNADLRPRKKLIIGTMSIIASAQPRKQGHSRNHSVVRRCLWFVILYFSLTYQLTRGKVERGKVATALCDFDGQAHDCSQSTWPKKEGVVVSSQIRFDSMSTQPSFLAPRLCSSHLSFSFVHSFIHQHQHHTHRHNTHIHAFTL